MDETEFIDSALGDPASVWSRSSLRELGRLQVPENLLGGQRSLLRADINEQWAQWFIESLADPRRFAQREMSYPHLFDHVFRVVDGRFHLFSKPQKRQLASSAAKIIQRVAHGFQPERRRRSVPSSERRLLLDLAGDPPRCWICGARFASEAIENFLNKENNEVPLPRFVDVLKPRGLTQRDLSIEADHVFARAHGGQDENNLALACGWCNRHKSASSSIYAVEGRPRTAGPNRLSLDSLPHPFWAVRLLAVVRECEHVEGCSCSASDANITVAPITVGGAMNPVNIRVSCYEHDPLEAIRLQPPNVVRDIWCMG